LGEGLRSIARLGSGSIMITNCSLQMETFLQLSITITGGDVHRDEQGYLTITVQTMNPFHKIQKVNELLGFNNLTLTSTSGQLSSEPADPTILTFDRKVRLPKGTIIMDIQSLQDMELLLDIDCHMVGKIDCFLEGQVLTGSISSYFRYSTGREFGLIANFRVRII
jgi:hypothetical protein